jgi:hypothetical protein
MGLPKPQGPLSELLPYVGIILVVVGALLFVLPYYHGSPIRNKTLSWWYGFLLLATGIVTLVIYYVPQYVYV